MKKKVLLITGGLITIVVAILLIVLLNQPKYTITVSRVDDQSPDRILTVYNDKNEKVEVKRIEYLDGTLLCNGYNTAVHFGDIEGITKVKVILKDRSEVIARIIKEEVK